MAISKVEYGGNTLVDLTSDTVTSDTMLSGYTAHDKAGNIVTGTVVVQKFYTGSSEPSSSLGNDGDLYLMI